MAEKTTRKIERGRFYWHKDGSSKGQHPAKVFKKRDKKNQYNIVCFTQSSGKGRTRLEHNVNPNSNQSCYVLNRPQIVKENKLGKNLKGYKVQGIHDRAVVNRIQRKKK